MKEINVYSYLKFVIYLCLCSFLIYYSYHYLDQPVAAWVYQHQLNKEPMFTHIVFIPNIMVYLTVLAVLIIFATSKISRVGKIRSAIIAITFSSLLAIVLTRLLKLIFGRIGPKYWIFHKFNTAAYGFHIFRGSSLKYQDFPSGHTAATFAVLTVIWLAYPRIGWIAIFPALLIVAALLFTHSHYFADCIGGAFLGAVTGLLTAHFFEVTKRKSAMLTPDPLCERDK